jgi:hypothetical protein
LKEQSRLKDKATGVDKDVRAPTKKTQYFLTMNGEIRSSEMHVNGLNSKCTAGPGKPALVPFPRGFKAKPGTPDGTLWWNNVSNLKSELSAVPLDFDLLNAPLSPRQSKTSPSRPALPPNHPEKNARRRRERRIAKRCILASSQLRRSERGCHWKRRWSECWTDHRHAY